jgi:hypothetical protein
MNPLIKKMGIKPPAVLHLLQVPQEVLPLFGHIEGLAVRQLAMDDNGCALRFRKVEYIKSMTRSYAMTEEGKRKEG